MMANTPEEAYQIALEKIREARKTGAKELHFSRLGLVNLPPEIGQLSNLAELYLSDNKLTSLPAEIKQLRRLIKLHLDGNEFTNLPMEIGQLTNLADLSSARNNLTSLPTEIVQLRNLKELNLAHNKFTTLPLEITQLTNLLELYFFSNKLTSLPPEIGQLINLKELHLAFNKITFLPIEITQLATNLTKFDYRGNSLTMLPAEVLQLTNLRNLYLSHNNLTALPAGICRLTQLTVLSAHHNLLTTLPREITQLTNIDILDIADNPLPIPVELINYNRNHKNFLKYYFSLVDEKKEPLGETKILVVGQGGVGKTSLIRRILENSYNPKENKTEGINICRFKFRALNKHYCINVWDVGGQEIMHATHQFFFTTRSLYLLVLDNRVTSEENRLDYWLKVINSFGGESPILIIGNKTDQHPLDVDHSGLQKKYSNIVGFLETSAATGVGIEALKNAIAGQVNKLPHVRDLLPKTWLNIKKELEERRENTNFINYDDYIKLCIENNVTDEISQRTLIGFLHDLGVVLHFQDDPRLEALGILNPQWVTNGVYKVLNSHALFQNKGALTIAMLNNILDLPEYPRDKRLFIVDMMKKFELCYDLEADKIFLVPDLLPKDEPTLDFHGTPAFEYHYPVLPSSVMTRLIVRMNPKIDSHQVWRSGVLLKIGDNRALIKADVEDRTVRIAIDGTEHTRRDALAAIRYQLDEIHASIKGLNPEKYVPVPGAPDATALEYETLLMMEQKGIETMPVKSRGKLIDVNIIQMLNGVESEYQRRQYGNVTNINIGGNVNSSTIIVGDDNEVKP